MKSITIIFIFLLLSVQSFCEKDSINTYRPNNEDKNIISQNLGNNIDYRLLYENEKEYNEKILGTIYWALSSILVIILAIIGSNIFFNFRFNKKQYQELENDLKQRLKELENEIIENNTEKQNKLKDKLFEVVQTNRNEILNSLSEDKKEIKQDLSKELSDFSENIKNQIDFIQKIIDERQANTIAKLSSLESSFNLLESDFEEYKEFVDSHVDKRIETLDKKIKEDIRYETNLLKLDVYDNDANIWELRGVSINALRGFIKEAKTKIELGWKDNLSYTLGSIYESLKNLNGYIYESEYNDLKMILDATPDKFINLTQSIKEKLSELEIKE